MQVGSFEEAEKAKIAGVDGIIVQGHEAGGHVIGQVEFYILHCHWHGPYHANILSARWVQPVPMDA